MAMNNLEALADYMFEEMERLNDIDLDEDDGAFEKLEAEIKRAKALGGTAKTIVSAGRTLLEAERFRADYTGIPVNVPKMLRE